MKQVSIFTIIRVRMLIRLALLLIVLAFAAKLLITNNPFGAKAAFTSTSVSCTLTNIGTDIRYEIPAECENKNVVINGIGSEYSVDAGSIRVKQDDTRSACSDANDPLCDSKRVFLSLTLSGTTKLTHNLLGASSDNNITDNTTGEERWKKIDIELTNGNLTLSDSARIDADGKGYSGGNSRSHPDGYGPYGGYGIVEPTEAEVGANGGGNWGDGGRGYCSSNGGSATCDPEKLNVNPYEGINPDQNNKGNIEFNFGSGGGYANQLFGGDKPDGTAGGVGGGRIRVAANGDITLGSASYITASGQKGTINSEGTDDEWEISGGGAGGSVLLYAKNFFLPTSNPVSNVYGAASAGGKIEKYISGGNGEIYEEYSPIDGALNWGYIKYGLGSDGLLVNDTISSIVTNIYSNGGGNYHNGNKDIFGGAGGGGQVVISDGKNQFTVKKKLEAIDRAGAGATFNPYALLSGDIIKVTIAVSNYYLERLFVVKDEFLKTSLISTKRCVFQAGSESPIKFGPAQISENEITWPGYAPDSADMSRGYIDFTYTCKVQ